MDEQYDMMSEEADDKSSLNKKIEELDKADPRYDDKRNTLMEHLQKFEQNLKKMRKEIKKQQEETRIATKFLRGHAEKDPKNKKLQELLEATITDSKFLTRAVVEMISIEGSIKKEINRIRSSQEFKQPLDLRVVTEVELKPLPSSNLETRKDKIDKITKKRTPSLRKKIAALRNSLPTSGKGRISDEARTR